MPAGACPLRGWHLLVQLAPQRHVFPPRRGSVSGYKPQWCAARRTPRRWPPGMTARLLPSSLTRLLHVPAAHRSVVTAAEPLTASPTAPEPPWQQVVQRQRLPQCRGRSRMQQRPVDEPSVLAGAQPWWRPVGHLRPSATRGWVAAECRSIAECRGRAGRRSPRSPCPTGRARRPRV